MVITRTNSLGLTYMLTSDGPAGIDTFITLVRQKGIEKVKTIVVNFRIDVVSQMWYDWQMGGHFIQDAFREFTPAQREFILTGITPDEWKEIFSSKEEI